MDIIKAKSDQDTKNGGSIVKIGSSFQTLDTSKDTEPDFNVLQNLNNINFDDPNYYWLYSSGILAPVSPTPTQSITPTTSVTPSITPTITPTPSVTSSETPTVTPTNTPSSTVTTTPSSTITTTPTPSPTSIQEPLFLASASNSSINARSIDGSSWTYGNFNNGRNWTGLTYGNNKFVAISTGAFSMNSPNGLTWTLRSINNNNWNNIVFNS